MTYKAYFNIINSDHWNKISVWYKAIGEEKSIPSSSLCLATRIFCLLLELWQVVGFSVGRRRKADWNAVISRKLCLLLRPILASSLLRYHFSVNLSFLRSALSWTTSFLTVNLRNVINRSQNFLPSSGNNTTHTSLPAHLNKREMFLQFAARGPEDDANHKKKKKKKKKHEKWSQKSNQTLCLTCRLWLSWTRLRQTSRKKKSLYAPCVWF